jgi:hypothetical protein
LIVPPKDARCGRTCVTRINMSDSESAIAGATLNVVGAYRAIEALSRTSSSASLPHSFKIAFESHLNAYVLPS